MTPEELSKIPFHFVSHCSFEHEHTTTYESEDGRLGYCDHVHYKNGMPCGRRYRHYRIGMKVYKTKQKFIEALQKI